MIWKTPALHEAHRKVLQCFQVGCMTKGGKHEAILSEKLSIWAQIFGIHKHYHPEHGKTLSAVFSFFIFNFLSNK